MFCCIYGLASFYLEPTSVMVELSRKKKGEYYIPLECKLGECGTGS